METKNPMRALLLINPASRSGGSAGPLAVQRLEEAGWQVSAPDLGNQSMGELIRSHANLCDLVVVGGGDGSMNAAAEALVETRLPMGILPLGTGNDLARTLGIPLDLDGAIDVLLRGRRQAIDVGRVNGRYYFNVASLGLSVTLTRLLSPGIKKRWGRFSYLLAAVRLISRRHRFAAELTVDGRRFTVRSLQIAVGNGRHYGGGLTIAPDARIDDRMLDVYSLETRRLWRMLVLAFLFPLGRHGFLSDVRSFRCRDMSIRTKRPYPVNADGEIVTQTPAHFSVLPGAVTILVPPWPADGRMRMGEGMMSGQSEDPLLIDARVVVLNEAIAQCRDAIEDFDWAARHLRGHSLADRIAQERQERAAILAALEQHVRDYGELPESRGTALGDLERVWGTIKAVFTGNDPAAALAELRMAEQTRQQLLPRGRGHHLDPAARTTIDRLHDATDALLAALPPA